MVSVENPNFHHAFPFIHIFIVVNQVSLPPFFFNFKQAVYILQLHGLKLIEYHFKEYFRGEHITFGPMSYPFYKHI